MTLLISKILSATVLKGVPSSFTLELPPYRKPQIGKVIVRSIFDRTLFVLGRAIVVAAPAGLIIWLMANISVGDATLLAHCSGFLDPFAQVIGMDGVIPVSYTHLEEEDQLLEKCTAAYHDTEHEFSIIYGDYYFLEALMKLAGKEVFLW